MLKKLQSKWKVSGARLFLILCTFALGGSLCGYAARRLLTFSGMEKGFAWIIVYIIMITLLWPLCVLLISIPFGQFRFFRNYLKRIAAKMSGKKKAGNIRLAIFASGGGSNAGQILKYFNNHSDIKPAVVISNNPSAGVLRIAEDFKVPAEIIDLKSSPADPADTYLKILKDHRADFIVLAGYLKKIPAAVIQKYPQRIVNIHPALLPRFGGPGMYGKKVHAAVIASGEKETGITIHYVDEIYDHGSPVFIATIPVQANDTADSLAERVLRLEHQHYAATIDRILSEK